MNILDKIYLGNPLQAWLTAAAIALVGTIIFQILKKVLVNRLGAFAKKTATKIDDLIVDLVRRIRFFFLLALAVYIATAALTLSPGTVRVIQSILIILCLLQGAIWGNAIISYWLAQSMKRRMEEDAASATTLSALGFMSRLVLWAIILLLALDNLGVNITALVAGLGVGGIAVALALQNILGDLLASLSIVLDKPFVIGDFIIVDEHLGSVEHIGLKTTRIRSLSGEQIIFSNADLLKSRIHNFKRMFERRIVFTVGVTYQTSYEQLAAIPPMIREIVESQELTRFDRSHFKEYGDSALTFETVYYLKSPDFNVYMDIQQAINLELFRRFQQLGIDFAYPTRTIFVSQNGDTPAKEIVGTDKHPQASGEKKQA
jgi:small-conductance mechanosensitive channel